MVTSSHRVREPLPGSEWYRARNGENRVETDKIFGAVYLVHLAVVAYFFVDALSTFDLNKIFFKYNHSRSDTDFFDGLLLEMLHFSFYGVAALVVLVVPLLATSICFCLAICTSFIFFMDKIHEEILALPMKCSLFLAPAVWILCTFCAWKDGDVVLGVIGVVFTLLTFVAATKAIKTIGMSTTLLLMAGRSIKANLWVYLLAAVAVILHLVNVFVWVVIIMAEPLHMKNYRHKNNDGEALYITLGVISLYWTSQVIWYTLHSTVAVTVAMHWIDPAKRDPLSPSNTWRAFSRTVSTSFGSICLASLVVAIVEYIEKKKREERERARNERRGLFEEISLGVEHSMVRIFGEAVKFLSRWSLIYTSVFGYDLLDAGQRVQDHFRSEGWSDILVDFSTSSLVIALSFFVGVVTGLLTGLFVVIIGGFYTFTTGFWCGSILGAFLSYYFLSILTRATESMVVCLAADPRSFLMMHPEECAQMDKTWTKSVRGVQSPFSPYGHRRQF